MLFLFFDQCRLKRLGHYLCPGGVGVDFVWEHFGVVAEGLVELDDGLARLLFEMGYE
ncbi:MAG: hypothetical protein OSB29_13940 [Verrucomicrobiota bacterium]|nr:hypothetical protein [Verrucomicrobiota bacterium]